MMTNEMDEDQLDAFERELKRLDHTDAALVQFASKLIEGKRYRIVSDNPDGENFRRHRELAEHMGATVELEQSDGGMTEIIYRPPVRQ